MPLTGKRIYRSVIFQVFLAMAVIAGMALASMSLSVYVTVNTQNDAEAINLAGSLRMQSYRISNHLALAALGREKETLQQLTAEMDEFAQKLGTSIIPLVVHDANNVPLSKSYQQVRDNWQLSMSPLLQATLQGGLSWQDSYTRYNSELDRWVADIDTMVTHLQRENEGKIELLGMTEAISIFLIVFIVLYLIMRADNNFVIPLRRLVKAAEDVERGNLSHRVSHYPENELGVLAASFNTMTASLQAQYRTLEVQVEERTRELHRSNQALYFLYKTSREISSSPYDERLLRVFLSELQKVANVETINLCVNAEPNYLNYNHLGTSAEEENHCNGDCAVCALSPAHLEKSHTPGISLPIGSRNDNYGFLYIKPHEGEKLLPWQNQLLNTVAETLSTSFAFHRNLGQEHRVMLLEERSTIARELHDSLAQSLSYMKMETARLKKLVDGDFQKERVDEAIADLQEGINAAYKHLRELLVTFRVKLDAPDLRTALQHAVQEFDEQSPARVTLEYNIESASLGPNGDIHVLHMVREALNNAVKHAGASTIALRCEQGSTGDLVFTIDDNGVGIPEQPEKEHHYGLYTMRERAQRLEGSLEYSVRDCGGTRVQLRVPAATGVAYH
ncbi:HAMP domain-containing protein [Pseudohalioglobus sediminis]|uniref:Sensor protein n=1 Tax=Pseudohalioglobus sediminis TaxID=2606449 RepID=A0A5B0WXR8_9GAMM|nr:histidine kinase [Pseudohalioglobus sediminis]KAA1191796.1 HAMP domain-containing protein [Pseudohalioglobus sediminis]